MSYEKKKCLMMILPLEYSASVLQVCSKLIEDSNDSNFGITGPPDDAYLVGIYTFDNDTSVDLNAFISYALGCAEYGKDIRLCYSDMVYDSITGDFKVKKVDYHRVRCGLLANWLDGSRETEFSGYLSGNLENEDAWYDTIHFFIELPIPVVVASFSRLRDILRSQTR